MNIPCVPSKPLMQRGGVIKVNIKMVHLDNKLVLSPADMASIECHAPSAHLCHIGALVDCFLYLHVLGHFYLEFALRRASDQSRAAGVQSSRICFAVTTINACYRGNATRLGPYWLTEGVNKMDLAPHQIKSQSSVAGPPRYHEILYKSTKQAASDDANPGIGFMSHFDELTPSRLILVQAADEHFSFNKLLKEKYGKPPAHVQFVRGSGEYL
ncbi:hypothetical protein JB92DRAFT_2826035 [Gautieria morchelliformis]|nr:hypothetical protein JB92DRAFT_2826035 [Gautieria morchelliformis]